MHSYNENLQSTFLKMLKCNFAMFSIWQASTWQTGVMQVYNLFHIALHFAELISDNPVRHLFSFSCNDFCLVEPIAMHTVLTPTRKSNRDSCWQFGYQALTGLGWLKNHVKVMGEREILKKILQV